MNAIETTPSALLLCSSMWRSETGHYCAKHRIKGGPCLRYFSIWENNRLNKRRQNKAEKVNRLRRTRETKHSWPSLKFSRIFTKTCFADTVQDFKYNHSLNVTRMLCQGWRYGKSPQGCVAKSLKFQVGCSAVPVIFGGSHNTVNSLAALLLLWVALIHLCVDPVPLKLKKNIVYSSVSSGLDTWGSISLTVDGTTGPSRHFQWNVQG